MRLVGEAKEFIKSHSIQKLLCLPVSRWAILDFFALTKTLGNCSGQKHDAKRCDEGGLEEVENNLGILRIPSLLAVTQELVRMGDHYAVRIP